MDGEGGELAVRFGVPRVRDNRGHLAWIADDDNRPIGLDDGGSSQGEGQGELRGFVEEEQVTPGLVRREQRRQRGRGGGDDAPRAAGDGTERLGFVVHADDLCQSGSMGVAAVTHQAELGECHLGGMVGHEERSDDVGERADEGIDGGVGLGGDGDMQGLLAGSSSADAGQDGVGGGEGFAGAGRSLDEEQRGIGVIAHIGVGIGAEADHVRSGTCGDIRMNPCGQAGCSGICWLCQELGEGIGSGVCGQALDRLVGVDTRQIIGTRVDGI